MLFPSFVYTKGHSDYPHLDTFLTNVMCWQSSWSQAANFATYRVLLMTFNLCCYPLLKEGICKHGMRQGKDYRVGPTLAMGAVAPARWKWSGLALDIWERK